MKKTAFIIIDVQKGMFLEEDPIYHGKELISNLKILLSRARASGIPIFYMQHNAPSGNLLTPGSKAWEIDNEIAPLKQDRVIQKTTPDSFYKTKLSEELRKQNINHLVLAGIQTEMCVDTTCRRAFSMEYEVTLVTDAHSTWDSDDLTAQQIIDHHNRLLRWFADMKETKDIHFKSNEEI